MNIPNVNDNWIKWVDHDDDVEMYFWRHITRIGTFVGFEMLSVTISLSDGCDHEINSSDKDNMHEVEREFWRSLLTKIDTEWPDYIRRHEDAA